MAVFLLWAGAAMGQIGKESENLGRLVESIAQELAQEGAEMGAQQVLEHFENLYVNPLKINRATKEDLEQLGILTDFQIASLLEYLGNSGYIYSSVELQLINGFNEHTVNLLRPFISFETTDYSKKGCNSTLLIKGWWREGEPEYLGPPYYTQLRYKLNCNERFGFGLVLEKDAGEEILGDSKIPFGDFNSFYLFAKDIALGQRLSVVEAVAGDYKVKLGQGLTVWNGFNLSGVSSVQGLLKSGGKITPSTSADENNFFRGGAVRLRGILSDKMELEGSFFLSLKNVDARINGKKYTSLPTDGLHNTESTLQVRKTLGELVMGTNLQLAGAKYRVGVNWVGYGYDKHNGRRVQDYNVYQMYNGMYGDFSVDFSAVFGQKRFFGECGVDYGGNIALLGGGIFRIGEWDAGATVRYYDKGYIAPYANAYSTISSCSNQIGVAMIGQRLYKGGLKISLGGDYSYYPWVRFNIGEPSAAMKLWGKLEYVSDTVDWNVKLYESYATYKSVNKLGVRGGYGRRVSDWLRIKLRGEVVNISFKDLGYAAALDFDLSFAKEILRLQLRGAYFNCKDWSARLYMYEADLPLSYTSRLFYGNGFKWFGLLSAKFSNKISLYIKSDCEPKIKIGLKMRFF